jgi:hypothetical protein
MKTEDSHVWSSTDIVEIAYRGLIKVSLVQQVVLKKLNITMNFLRTVHNTEHYYYTT